MKIITDKGTKLICDYHYPREATVTINEMDLCEDCKEYE